MEDAEVVGVGGESVSHVELRLPLGRKHRSRVDAPGPGPEGPAISAEDGTERAFGNCCDLPDEIELVVLQPSAHGGIELG